jgi:hypothetical protein
MKTKKELINVIKTYENILRLKHEYFQEYKKNRDPKIKIEIFELMNNMKECNKLLINKMIEYEYYVSPATIQYKDTIYILKDSDLIRIDLKSTEKLDEC